VTDGSHGIVADGTADLRRAELGLQVRSVHSMRMLHEEVPHDTAGVDVICRAPRDPFRPVPAPWPRTASTLNGVENHVRVVSAGRVLAYGSRDPEWPRFRGLDARRGIVRIDHALRAGAAVRAHRVRRGGVGHATHLSRMSTDVVCVSIVETDGVLFQLGSRRSGDADDSGDHTTMRPLWWCDMERHAGR